LQRGSGKYKEKLPFKCFNYGKVGHFQNKCPYPKRDYEDERDKDKTFKKREESFYKQNHYKGKKNFYSKEEESSSNGSSDSDEEKVLFLGIEEENEHEEDSKSEEEVNMEVELVNALSELKRYRNKYRQLKNFVIEKREKQEQEEKENDSLINELEEAKRTEEELKDLLDEKEKSCQNLEIEMVDLKRKFEANNNVHDRIKNNSIILVKFLDSQKSPFDKTGIMVQKGRRTIWN
jgi:hypothetical protein